MEKKIFTYKTIALESQAEFTDRGSKFLAYAIQINNLLEVKSELKKIKELHPKAVHHCYAYRLGITQNEYRANDDGEPSGSAGRPILSQIDSTGITNILIVVVRYFGGVLLGVPGLINAYKTVAKQALENNEIVEKNVTVSYNLSFEYSLINEVMRILKSHSCEITNQMMGLFCEITIQVPLQHEDAVSHKLNDIHGVEMKEVG